MLEFWYLITIKFFNFVEIFHLLVFEFISWKTPLYFVSLHRHSEEMLMTNSKLSRSTFGSHSGHIRVSFGSQNRHSMKAWKRKESDDKS